MDKLILHEKLDALARCLQRIEAKTPTDLDVLTRDADLQDILVLNLTRAVQLCVDIGSHVVSNSDAPPPQTMGQVFTTLATLGFITNELAEKLRRAVGFRNIAIHNYERVDWAVVHAICIRFLGDFRAFASAMLARV